MAMQGGRGAQGRWSMLHGHATLLPAAATLGGWAPSEHDPPCPALSPICAQAPDPQALSKEAQNGEAAKPGAGGHAGA